MDFFAALLILMAVSVSPVQGLRCIHQEDGNNFWSRQECDDNAIGCLVLKECPKFFLKRGLSELDEMRGCADENVCAKIETLPCDCRFCQENLCNAGIGQQQQTQMFGILMLGLALAFLHGPLMNLLMAIGNGGGTI